MSLETLISAGGSLNVFSDLEAIVFSDALRQDFERVSLNVIELVRPVNLYLYYANLSVLIFPSPSKHLWHHKCLNWEAS